jgi:hypothetical protein
LNPNPMRRVWVASLVTSVALLMLSGCQFLNGNSSGNSSLSVANASLSFGSVPVGSSKSLQDTLTNNSLSSVTISAVSGSSTSLQVTGLTTPITLAAGQSVTFTVQYKPASTGNLSQTISFLGANSEILASLAATGTASNGGALTLNPSQLTFGSVTVGSNKTATVTISNTGTADLTLNKATLSGAGFTMSNLTLPLTLHTGSSVSATVTFAPTTSSSFSGSVTFATTGAQGNVTLSLSGTGAAAGQISASPSSLSFGSVTVGSTTSKSETLTNTGTSSVTISQAKVSGAGLSISGLSLPITVAAGKGVTFTVKFAPASAGAVSGSLAITSDTNSLNISLSGTGATPGSLSANPTTLSFGNIAVGSNASKSETVTNTGGATVSISQANVTGSGYSMSGLTLPMTLAASQSVTFTVKFAPSSAGTVNGSLSLVSNASNSPLSISLSGTGTTPGQLAASPTTLSFGSLTVGSSSALTGTLSASGASVTVSSASSNSGEFTLSGITLPTTLTAGQSVGFKVTFKPQATGTATATLTFASNATNGPTTQSLTGSGTAAAHSVSLSWSASSGAVGYNVYRGTVSGGPYTMINPSLNTSTSYSDTTVAAGTTYYYVVTAVDSSSNESAYSNQAKAVVPSP